jgi:hypothetical protein
MSARSIGDSRGQELKSINDNIVPLGVETGRCLADEGPDRHGDERASGVVVVVGILSMYHRPTVHCQSSVISADICASDDVAARRGFVARLQISIKFKLLQFGGRMAQQSTWHERVKCNVPQAPPGHARRPREQPEHRSRWQKRHRLPTVAVCEHGETPGGQD